MATSLGSFAVDLLANIARFESDLGKAKRLADQRAEQISKAFANAGVAIGTGLAAGITALTALTKQAINTADQIENMRQKVGMSAESLSTLGYAAKQSDVDLGSLQGGLVKLAKNASDAAQGTGTAVDAFAALGVSVKEADGSLKGSDKLLKELATEFAKYEDGANKTALAVGVFGRAGANLIPLLNEGADGIGELEERARALGLEIGGETAAAAERFNDTLEDSANLMKGLGLDIADAILPQLNALINAYVNAGIEGRKTADVTDAIRASFDFLAITFVKGVEATQDVGAAIGYVVDAVGSLLGAIKESTGPLSTYFDALTDVLSGDIVSAADKYEKALEQAAAVGTEFGESLKNSGEALKSSFAANAAAAESKIDAMAEATLNANNAIKDTEQVAKRAAPAIVSLAKAQADAAKAAAEEEKALRALDKEWDAYARVLADVKRDHDEVAAAYARLQRHFDDQAKDIEDEIRLLGLSGKAREREIILLEAERLARDETGTVIEEQRQRYEDLLTTLSESQKMERAAAEVAAVWANFTDGIEESLTDAIVDGGEAGVESLKRAFESLQRDMTRGFINAITSAFKDGGVQGVISGFQNNFNRGAGFTNSAAQGGGVNWGNVGQTLGGAYGVYDAYRNGSGGWDGAGQGAMAGAQAGAAFGPWGAVIGGIVGAFAGYFGGGDPTIRVSDREGDATARSRLDDVIGVARDHMEPGTATAFADAIRTFDNTLADIFDSYSSGAEDMERVRAALANWSIRVEGDAATIENVLGERFGDILATFSQDVQDFVNEADTLEDRVSRFAEVLMRADQITSIMDALAESDMLAGMTEAERALYALNQQYDAVIDQLESLEASESDIAQVEEYRARAIARLTTAQVANTAATEEAVRAYADFVSELTDGGGSDFQRALRDVRRELAETVDRANELARAAGLQAAREEDLIGARMRAQDQIADLIAGLTESVIQQIADLYGTSAQQLESQIAAIDAEIEAMDRSDSTFGMLFNLQREAQLGAERLRLQDELAAQLAEEERIRRRLGAMDLAQNLADLGLARGVGFEQLANELGLNLDRFGNDLGITASAVGDFIRALEADSLTADVFGQGVEQIVNAILATRITDPKPIRMDDDETGIGIKSRWNEIAVEQGSGFREELALLRETVEFQTGVIAGLLEQGNQTAAVGVTVQQDTNRALRGNALDNDRQRGPSDRQSKPKARL